MSTSLALPRRRSIHVSRFASPRLAVQPPSPRAGHDPKLSVARPRRQTCLRRGSRPQSVVWTRPANSTPMPAPRAITSSALRSGPVPTIGEPHVGGLMPRRSSSRGISGSTPFAVRAGRRTRRPQTRPASAAGRGPAPESTHVDAVGNDLVASREVPGDRAGRGLDTARRVDSPHQRREQPPVCSRVGHRCPCSRGAWNVATTGDRRPPQREPRHEAA